MWVLIYHKSMKKSKKVEFKTFEELRTFVSENWNTIIIDRILNKDGEEWK